MAELQEIGGGCVDFSGVDLSGIAAVVPRSQDGSDGGAEWGELKRMRVKDHIKC